MTQVSVTGPAAKAFRAARDTVAVFDGGEVLGRFTPVAVILTDRERARLSHFPHPAGECFGTCWRHTSEVAAGQ